MGNQLKIIQNVTNRLTQNQQQKERSVYSIEIKMFIVGGG
jgi:hypothetical protein